MLRHLYTDERARNRAVGVWAAVAGLALAVGPVLGVAVLGALVNAQLHSDLISRLNHLRIPANFQSIVVNAVETGGVPPSGTTSSAGGPGNAAVVQQVINAAYHAFGTGLHAALYLAAGLVVGAGILTAVTLRPPARTRRAPSSGSLDPGRGGP